MTTDFRRNSDHRLMVRRALLSTDSVSAITDFYQPTCYANLSINKSSHINLFQQGISCPGNRSFVLVISFCSTISGGGKYEDTINCSTTDLGPVCFCFSGPRFFENQDSEISQLSGESTVWISWVFGNPDYFESIL